MNQYLSDKLRIFSFFLIILVLYIHTDFHENELEGMFVNKNIQLFISGMVGRCAVPLFYIISGYLFFLKLPNGMNSIYGKMRKRVKTLFIPYVIGCLFFVGILSLVEIMPGTSRFMNGAITPLFQKKIEDIVCAIFYDAGNGGPCAFQLWFLRDLLIIVATSPLWYLCLKRMKWAFVVLTFGLTYLQIPHVPFYALFWFVLGGQLVKAKTLSGWGCSVIVTSVLFLVVSGIQLFMTDVIDWEVVKIPVILLGIYSAWGLYDMVVGENFVLSEHRWLATACQFTFFIYLFHEPTLNIVRKLILVVLGKNEYGYLIAYLISPWIFTICFVFIGLQFRKYLPKVYNVCTGGR